MTSEIKNTTTSDMTKDENKYMLSVSEVNGASFLTCEIKDTSYMTIELNDPLANHPYISPCKNRLPIIGTSVINNEFNDNKEKKNLIFKDFKECGFDAFIQYTDTGGTLDSPTGNSHFNLNYWLKTMAKYQTKVLIANNAIFAAASSSNRAKFFNGIKETLLLHNMVGTWLHDEPDVMQCCSLNEGYNLTLEKYAKLMCVLNLIGPQGESYNANLPYSDYLDVIQAAFRPAVWSFDYYPFVSTYEFNPDKKLTSQELDAMMHTNVCNAFNGRQKHYYNALESMSSISKKTLRPFWSVLCSQAHYKITEIKNEETGDLGKIRYTCFPVATLGHLRFGVFSALAYGAQGIIYWSYMVGAKDRYSALVSRDGERSDAWFFARQVNAEARAYEHVFFGSEVIYVRHLGSKIDYTTELKFPFGPMVDMECQGQDAGAIVSLLRNGCKKYLVVVSRNPFNSISVTIKFEDITKILEITPTSPYPQWAPDEYIDPDTIKRELTPGGYLIFEY